MSAHAANLVVAAAVLLTGIAAVLFVLGMVSWRRVRHGRLFWVAAAFGVFAFKGLYLARQAYAQRAAIQDAGLDGLLPSVILLDLFAVACLYLAAWTR